MLLLWSLLLIVFLFYSTNLLLSLLVLELMGFMLIFYISLNLSAFFVTDSLVVFLFCVFVMEGVIALSGLISLVSFSGSDYVMSSSFTRC
uniref:NADH dehydrogenase subunit 4L n=1 Tax=Proales similis TaxID=360698 RepID=A0A7D4XD10_9BILA|nr:NADH dehydrogenase subunit 4L [Proales similis]